MIYFSLQVELELLQCIASRAATRYLKSLIDQIGCSDPESRITTGLHQVRTWSSQAERGRPALSADVHSDAFESEESLCHPKDPIKYPRAIAG